MYGLKLAKFIVCGCCCCFLFVFCFVFCCSFVSVIVLCIFFVIIKDVRSFGALHGSGVRFISPRVA